MRRVGTVAVVVTLVAAVAGAAYAASFTLTTQHLGATSVSTPVLFPRSIATTNNGNRAGQIQKTDTVTWTWPVAIDQTTLCSGWSNAQIANAVTMTWTISNNTGSTGNDVLLPGATGATCSSGLHIGSVDLGSSSYVTGANGTMTSAQTTVFIQGGITTLTMTVPNGGVTGGTVGTVSSGSAAVWTPDAAVTDLSGNNCAACLAKSTTTVQF